MAARKGACPLFQRAANPTGTVTVNRGNAGDTLTLNGLPDLNAGLTIGSSGNPFAALTLSGPVTLASHQNLTGFAAGTIDFNSPTADLATSGTGSISLTSQGGLTLSSGASIATGGSGGIRLASNSMALDAASSITASRPATVALIPFTPGSAIDLGGVDGSGTLGLTDAELDRITAGLVQIGDANSGTITVSSAITHGNNMSLTGAAILLAANISTDSTATAGSLNLNGPVIIADGTAITLDTDSTGSDGAITLASTLNGTTGGGNESVVLNAGTGGNVSLAGVVEGFRLSRL